VESSHLKGEGDTKIYRDKIYLMDICCFDADWTVILAVPNFYSGIKIILWHIRSKQELWSHKLIVTRQQPIGYNRGIHHAIAKKQMHCKRGIVFSKRSRPRCYKQDQLAVAVR
jgi:hypothetical protein